MGGPRVIALFCFFILLNLALNPVKVKAIEARSVLYDQKDFKGKTHISTKVYKPNLGTYGWNDKAQSVCVTGTWLFYRETGYNDQKNALMEYVFGPETPYCVNFGPLAGAVRSLRFTGVANDYRGSSINFYEQTYFQWDKELFSFNWDVPVITFAVKSIIVTGAPEDGWTIYDQVQYGGKSMCLFPPSNGPKYVPYFLPDTTLINIPHSAIKSLRKGCHSNNLATEWYNSTVTGSNALVL